ncbi:MAG: DUF1998 domain-containing protein [Myxococcales bacterium]|nr:DUF1998 domain-containing protein [Myxococcales bacterium]
MITTYGPGALVDLLHDAVMISGLDFWRSVGREWDRIDEPRLANRLARRLKSHDRPLDVTDAFRAPPAGDDQTPRKSVGIDALQFPDWFVCQNTECRALIRATAGLTRKRDRWVHDCTKRGSECVPVRFLSACRNGHIDEFPWVWFVHQTGTPDQQACKAPSLVFDEGPSGDFASIRIRCRSCGAVRQLIDARGDESANPHCRGRRPWLGPVGAEGESCTERTRLLVRTASNAYFSVVESALSIPDTSVSLWDVVRASWATLQAATPDSLPVFRTIPAIADALGSFDDASVLRVVDEVRRGHKPEPPPLRHAEYSEFVRADFELPGERPPTDNATFFPRAVPPPAGTGISRVVLAHNLREVRALVGFTRIEPPAATLQGEHEVQDRIQPIGVTQTWLPASEIRGEGVFIELDPERLAEWEARQEVRDRAAKLYQGWLAHRHAGGAGEFPGARFYLLHSLSHLLITALSLECGYSASSIRERIYCAPPDHEAGAMSGLLLSTGSPGTDGTLGGLVEQGRFLADHLERALRLGSLCSNDPVCAGHEPTDGSERWLDGAACHGCLYVAECSCEWFNRYLDRALVVPTIGADPRAAFFAAPPLL